MFALAYALLTLVIASPPIHEGIHAMMCEMQGGATCGISMTSQTCDVSNFDTNAKEKWYAMPFGIAMLFSGITLKSLLEAIEVCRKKE